MIDLVALCIVYSSHSRMLVYEEVFNRRPEEEGAKNWIRLPLLSECSGQLPALPGLG